MKIVRVRPVETQLLIANRRLSEIARRLEENAPELRWMVNKLREQAQDLTAMERALRTYLDRNRSMRGRRLKRREGAKDGVRMDSAP